MRFILFLPLLFTGCSHVIKSGAKPSAAAVAQTRVLTVRSSSGPAETQKFPSEFEEYYVGMIADYDDPTFAYRPGSLMVQVRPSRLGGAGGGGVAGSGRQGPSTTSGQSSFHPDPTETEISALVSRSQRAISALTEENERLLLQVQELRQPTKVTAASVPVAQPADRLPATGVRSDDSARLNLIRPNRDYVIELDPNFFLTPSPTTNNPFVQLYQPPISFRDLSLVISAAVPGPNPSAVINNEPYSIGDRLEGLTVHRIEPDTVYLLKDAFLLACPVSENVLKLRIP